MQKKFLAISGSNEDIRAALRTRATELEVQVDCFQCHGEEEIIDCLKKAGANYAGAIIDAGASANCGDSLRSAIAAAPFPCVQVSLSNVQKGEESSHKSPIASACVGVIGGFGTKSYLLALEALVELTR